MSARVRGVIYFLFLAGFLISAPLVVLYTAGYRYSFGAGRIVQTGVLSVTTAPKGAQIRIDDVLQSGRSPLVVDNVLPGEHVIHVTKEGYSSWQKTLEILSRDTTFVKDVLLFLTKEPERIRSMNVLAVSHAPQGDLTAYAAQEGPWLELWMFESSSEEETLLARVPSDATSRAEISWSSGGTYVAATLRSASDQLFSLIDIRDMSSSSVDAIVPGATSGTWDTAREGIFFASRPDGIWEVEAATKTAKPLPSTPSAVTSDGTSLVVAQSIDDRIVVSRLQGESGTILAYLPLGDYVFHPSPAGTVLLEDTSRNRIILLDAKGGDQPILLNAEARLWDWESGGTRFLYSNGFDLHVYDPTAHTDETITRVSDEITGLTWYPEPKSAVLYAQKQSVSAIELDRRNGRNITTLALGEDVHELWVDEKGITAFFFGKIGEETGLYKRRLQR